MKKYSHAWLALQAVKHLKRLSGGFNTTRNRRLTRFVDFISEYPETFVRGAWFPDIIIKDNTQGGHTWKYFLDSAQGRSERRRPPEHNQCLETVRSKLSRKVSLDARTSDLPDRCEALGQMIRDTILITNKTSSGDVVVYNNSQVALSYLMLAHYVGDAHVPPHCDKRDFYKPSKIHPDLEGVWEHEVKKYYRISTAREQFDLDEEGELQLKPNQSGYEQSALFGCQQILQQTPWQDMNTADSHWSALLGDGNNNFWDYLVSVCLVSFHLSVHMFPLTPPAGVDYNTVRIMDVPRFREKVEEFSPRILADAVNSIALLWLAAWERWELLAKGKR